MAVTAKTILESLSSKGYTERQIVNSLARSLAHVKLHVTDERTIKAWDTAYHKATVALTKAHADHYVPCDPRCEWATEDHCECFCGGVNHGHFVHSGLAA